MRTVSGMALVLSAGIFALGGCNSAQVGAGGTVAADRPPQAADTGAAGQAPAASETPISAANIATPPRPKLKPGARTKVLGKAGDRSYDKTFDDLRFEMTVGEKFQRSMLTAEIEQLNGQKVRIRGYILPTPQKHGITQFVLVRDNQECCFGPGAALYDCILVEMNPGVTADFTIRPIAVEGKFEVREFVIDGKHLAIYNMEGESAG